MKNKKKRVVKLLPLLLVGVLGVFLLLSPAVKISGNRFVLTKEETNLNQTTPLKDIVNTALEGATGTYGIVIQNLKTGETYYSNEQIVFDAGSLYKLWVMATAYQQIKNGQLQENQVLSQDATVLNQEFNIDANSAEQTEGEVTFTVADALTQMITVSDNYTALLLTEKVGLSAVATFLKENGLTKSNLGSYNTPPTTTPYDTALFFKKLYQSELANQQNTQEMLNLLANQQLNNGLPKYLPPTVKVAHKTGEIDSFKHDAGIVFTDNGNYILVVMSQSDSPPDAMERIALISKGVFDYNQKPR